MSDWKSCGNCFKDGRCYVLSVNYDPALFKACINWEPIHCPKCGGILSEIRTNGSYPHRHCYSCNFDIQESEVLR